MQPTISMVTPVWNGERFLGLTLQSVREQEPHVLEHIIQDANSSDKTPDIIREMARPYTRHIRESDRGLYDAMNRGIALAQGDVVGIINADDTLAPGALASVRKAFEDPDLDYVYSDVHLVSEEGGDLGLGQSIGVLESPPVWPFGFDWRFYTPFYHQGFFVRRSAYLRMGSYDTAYRYSADHELMARFIHAGLKGQKIEAPLAFFRLGGLSSGSVDIFREDEAIAVKYGMPSHLAKLNRLKCTLGRIKQRWVGR
jgi:glycosyltransferase involved in cell wall biosynthesis